MGDDTKLYLLVELPVSAHAPLRTQQLAHKRWMDPLVAVHGGRVRMALRADVMHAFALDLEPPLHYYRDEELDSDALVAEYSDLKWQSEDRMARGLPWNWAHRLENMEAVMTARGIPFPKVSYPGEGRPVSR